MKKIFKKSIPFLLILSNLNALHVHGESTEKDDNQPLITLYEQETLEEPYLEIPKESKVILKQIIDDELLLIEYYPEKNEEEFEKDPLHIGYISIEDVSHIENIEELEVEDELFLYPELDEEKKKIEDIEKTDEDLKTEDSEKAESEIEDSEKKESETEDSEKAESEIEDSEEKESETEDSEKTESEIEDEESISLYSVSKEISYRGRANKKVHVYSETDKDSSVLKSYSEGSILQYRGNDTSTWYTAKVKVDGQWETGYISHQDVENITENQVSLRGISVKNRTHVYSRPTTSSSIRRSYSQGRLLRYKTFTKDWYQATVIVNGRKQTGYIHKSHVEEPVEKQKSLRGISIQSPTRVYKDASTASGVWKSYKSGKILRFKTYTNDWYEATVIIKGKKETGYIHRSHVEIPTENPESLRGIGIKSPTRVYKDASTASGVWKAYKSGRTLRFRTFTKNWYQATVLINGKKETGYIHQSDVELPVETQESLKGISLESPTNVYKETSTSSSVWKSYRHGRVLRFKTYTSDWYEATVIINGKRETGYIRKSDVVIANGNKVVIDAGHGGKDPGSSGHGLKEKDLTLKMALKVEKMLARNGYEVVMTRTGDKTLSLKERTDLANKAKADIMVSVHVNSFTSGSANGIETWYMDEGPKPKESKTLANFIQSEVMNETDVTDRGVKEGNLHINRESEMPSALIETGFISNEDDSDNLKNESFINRVVKGIVNGILNFFS